MTVDVQVGTDSVVMTATTPTQLKAQFAWGTDPDDLSHMTDWQLGKGDGPYTYSWVIYDMRQATDTMYESTVFYNDGSSEQASWTQPGLDASPDDVVNFRAGADIHWHTLSDHLQTIALRGWSFQAEWAEVLRMAEMSSEFNTITWADGR